VKFKIAWRLFYGVELANFWHFDMDVSVIRIIRKASDGCLSCEVSLKLLENSTEIVGFDPIESAAMSFGLFSKVFYPSDLILSTREEIGM
jgi:hypothetical protein